MRTTDSGACQVERGVRQPLTRPQLALLHKIKDGAKVCAEYLGGPATDMHNWHFTIWHDGEYEAIEGCDVWARALLASGLVEIYTGELGYRFLRQSLPNVEFSGVPAGHLSNHPAGGTKRAP